MLGGCIPIRRRMSLRLDRENDKGGFPTLNIAVFHNLPSGGALRALYEKIKLFENKGHRVSLFTFSTFEKGFLSPPKFSGNYFEAELSFSGPLKFFRYFKASRLCAISCARGVSEPFGGTRARSRALTLGGLTSESENW